MVYDVLTLDSSHCCSHSILTTCSDFLYYCDWPAEWIVYANQIRN